MSAQTSLCILLLATTIAAARAESFDCIMEPAQKVKIGSAVTGVLKKVFVRRGDKIVAGQVIAELDDSIEAANLALAATQAGSIEAIEAQRSKARLAKDKLDRASSLATRDIVSKDKLEGFQVDYEVAQRDLNAELVKHRVAELETERAKAALALRTIRSPLDGLVLDRNLLPGEFVNQEAFIMTLVQIDPLYVEAYVPVAYYKSIRRGMDATISPAEPIGGRFKAPVTVVDHVFDAASGTFQIRLELANPGNLLPGGTRCRVELAVPPLPVSTQSPDALLKIKPDGENDSTFAVKPEDATPGGRLLR